METQTPNIQSAESEARDAVKQAVDPVTGEFVPGAIVAYGLHGKCVVTAIETRTVGGQSMRFYRLDILKSALSRSTRQEPSIFIPVEHARSKGLRLMLGLNALAVLALGVMPEKLLALCQQAIPGG